MGLVLERLDSIDRHLVDLIGMKAEQMRQEYGDGGRESGPAYAGFVLGGGRESGGARTTNAITTETIDKIIGRQRHKGGGRESGSENGTAPTGKSDPDQP